METREDIIKKIADGVYQITPKRKCKSQVWNLFSEVQRDDGTLVEETVYCRSCNRVYKFNGRQTSNLIRHKCHAMRKAAAPLKQITHKEKQIVLDACSQWMIKDCRPITLLDSGGFRVMVQTFIKIGASFGENLDINDLLPDPITISRLINTMAADKKFEKQNEIKKIVEETKGSITLDLAKDNFTKRNYLCATFHYVHNGRFQEMLLGIKSMHPDECTGEHIYNKMKSILAEFGVNSLTKIVFVTNSAANMQSAFRDLKRINCSNDLFSTVLDAAFDAAVELHQIIDSCKNVQKYLKEVNFQHLLPITFKRHCMTLWKSHLNLFKFIFSNWTKINDLLFKINEMHRVSGINIHILSVLVELCEYFEMISKKLQSTKCASICYVYPSINGLRKICEVTDQDASAISSLKNSILHQMDANWIPQLSLYHKAAVFLYPPTNQVQEESIICEVKNFCVTEILQNETSVLNTSIVKMEDASCSNSQNVFSPLSNSKEMEFFFPDLSSRSNVLMPETANDEVQKYSWIKVPIDTNFDAIEWWENNKTDYPNLSKFAIKILSIPASNCAAKAVFSLAGSIIAEKSNDSMPKAVDSIMYLNSIFKENT